MTRHCFAQLVLAIWLMTSMDAWTATFPLKTSADGRHLVDQKGEHYFYNADTAWMLLLKLTEAEADEYMALRQEQGFNTIQIIFTGFLGSTNRTGTLPFEGGPEAQDITRPNEQYFSHADRVLKRAADRGLLVAIAPAWAGCCGEGWAGKNKDGSLKPLDAAGPEKSRQYGNWLGKRYAGFKNIIWILGGDNDPGSTREPIRALGLGLKEAAPHHLITYHAASSHSSTDIWPNEQWLNVPMIYTYFRGFNKAWNKHQPDVYEVGWKEYAKNPPKPFFLGESTYEGEHGAWGSALQARKQAYWAVLSGGIGNAYGSPNWNIPSEWRQVLKSPGAQSLKHFRSLFEQRAWWKLVPDKTNSFLTAGQGTPATNNLAIAAVASDKSFAIVYSPSPRNLRIETARLGHQVIARWYDPTDGTFRAAEQAAPDEFRSPEKNARGASDWVLVIEKAPAPGKL